jgi:chitodextrinase
LALLVPITAVAAPLAASNFAGVENPLSENGAWLPLTSLAPNGSRFQKNNGAFPTMPDAPNHASARTTAAVPPDHYSEIVVQHLGSRWDNVGPLVRVQPSGPSIDSHYLWWGGLNIGQTNGLYRIDANGTSYGATQLMPTPPVADGDTLRFIARGPVIYGVQNGVRAFIYNTGPNAVSYSTGTTGILAYAGNADVSGARIASWSTGAAPASAGTSASSNFAGSEDPLDEADTWYPLPGYQGFKKVGGFAVGKEAGQNAAGAWSITPPANQYSEVTLGSVAGGGGGPIVRIDRTSAGQTGWLLFVSAADPTLTGIYKITPGGFSFVQPFTAAVLPGDKWRLAATGNILEVFRNGVSQLTYTTDGSYPSGDVGIEAFTPTVTFSGWTGGELAVAPQAPAAPSNAIATATGSTQITLIWDPSSSTAVTSYLVERCKDAGCTNFAQVAAVASAPFNDAGLTSNTSYSYRVRAADAAGNKSTYSNVATAATLVAPPTAPSNLIPTNLIPSLGVVGTRIRLAWTPSISSVGVKAYLVERCRGTGCTTFVQVGTVVSSPFDDDTGLEANTHYRYRVKAVDVLGHHSPYSDVVDWTSGL